MGTPAIQEGKETPAASLLLYDHYRSSATVPHARCPPGLEQCVHLDSHPESSSTICSGSKLKCLVILLY